MTERAEAAESRATELLSQLNSLRCALANERIEQQNDNEDLARTIRQLAEVQSAHQRTIADSSQLRNDLKESEQLAWSLARSAMSDVLEKRKLAEWLADARIEIGVLTDTNAALARRWADTRPPTPSVGDEVRAIWARNGGNETGAELDVMDYMTAHDSPCSLANAKRLIGIHVHDHAIDAAIKEAREVR
jgi:hypothetical protein